MALLSRKPASDRDPYEEKTPFLAGTIIGIRQWHSDLSLSRLRPLTRYQDWKMDGKPTEAVCANHEGSHQAPDPDCDCGLHAYHPWSSKREHLSLYFRDSQVTGLVAAWGKVEVHGEGFRAQYAKPMAFVLPPATTLLWRFERLNQDADFDWYSRCLKRLAEDCGAEIIDMSDENALDDWLSRNPSQLGEQVVARLLAEAEPARPVPDPRIGVARKTIGLSLKVIGYTFQACAFVAVICFEIMFWILGLGIAYVFFVGITGWDPINYFAR
ncbi:MAG: hypothetical protein KDB48_05645 [Solirubrobacterales bacterium]|nr:hypothetical protein [Solirubrobacterales bacterium]